MSDERGVVHTVSWRDLCPWLILPRAFGTALNLPLLFLAIVALVITPIGWRVSGLVFLRADSLEQDPAVRDLARYNQSWPGSRDAFNPGDYASPRDTVGQFWFTASEPALVYHRLSHSFWRLFDVDLTLSKFAYFFFGGLWTLVVWGFFGGAITRMAAVQLGREERIGLVEAVRFAARKLVHYVAAPLAPLAVIALLTVLIVPAGWFLNVDVGVVLAGLLWFLVLLASFIMTVLLLGLLFGWPLMWGTISTEGSDALDAVSRSYSYVFQRPLHYLFYGVVAILLGTLVWWLIAWFSETVVDLSFWAASWGAGRNRMAVIEGVLNAPPASQLVSEAPHLVFDPATGSQVEVSTPLWIGGGLLAFWIGLVRTIGAAVGFAFFWCLTSAVYLLLRRDVDQTEFDEVYTEEEEDRYGLPPLTIDRSGVPTVAPEPTADPHAGGDTGSGDTTGGGQSATPPPLPGDKSGETLNDEAPPPDDEPRVDD